MSAPSRPQPDMQALAAFFLGAENQALTAKNLAGPDDVVQRGQHAFLHIVTTTDSLRGLLTKHPEAAKRLAAETASDLAATLQTELERPKSLEKTLQQRVWSARLGVHQAFESQGADIAVTKASQELNVAQTQLAEFRSKTTIAVTRRFRAGMPALAEQLRKRASVLAEREDKVRDWFGSSPGLFDLEEGAWQKLDFSGLEACAHDLQSWPSFLELARRIGQHHGAKTRTHNVEEAVVLPDLETEAVGRSELTGYEEGRDLAHAIAQEIALLSDPATESLFFQRFADARLTILAYQTSADVERDHGRRARVSRTIEEPVDEGPVILLVDTSGSMSGSPERAARILALALARTCIQSGRACKLVAFSTEIKVFDLAKPENNLAELSAFLGHSFRGGTDLRPALATAVDMLADPACEGADVVIVSDFRVPKIIIKNPV